MKNTAAGLWWGVGLTLALCLVGLFRPAEVVANGTNVASFQSYEARITLLLQLANPSVPSFQMMLIQEQLKATENDIRNPNPNTDLYYITIFEDFQLFIRLWQNYRIPGNYRLPAFDPSGNPLNPDLSRQVQHEITAIVEKLAHDPALDENLDDSVEVYTRQQWDLDVIPDTDPGSGGF